MHPNNTPNHTTDSNTADRKLSAKERMELRVLEGLLKEPLTMTEAQNKQLQLLLDEVEVLGSSDRSERTSAEYRQLQEHWAHFCAGFGVTLAEADKTHAGYFMRHLTGSIEKPVTKRLVERCTFCESHGRRPDGYSASYVKRHLAAVKALYDYLLDKGLAAQDPTSRLKRPTVVNERQYTPSLAEVRALMDYHGTPMSRLSVRWAYYEPARRSEHVSVRWSDIDEFGRWHLLAKGGKRHGYDLHPEVRRALRAHRAYQERQARRYPAMARALADEKTAWVFMTRSGRQMTGGQFVRILKRHAVHAGVAVVKAPSEQWDTIGGMTSRLSPHALHRAWATHSLNDPQNPVPIDVVSVVLGHANIETTRRHYAGTDDGRASDALRRRRL